MITWKRVRGALGMGVVWAIGGFAVGAGIELIDNLTPNGFLRFVDMWPQTLALLALPRGVLFGALVGAFGAGRQLGDFTFRQFTAWGTVAGLVVGGVSALTGFDLGAFLIPTALSAVAGAGTLGAARIAERAALPIGRRTETLKSGNS